MDSLKSLQSNPLYKIDVYLILGWELKDERRALIMDALSIINDVGIEIWDDAIPLSYDKFSSDTMSPCTRCLARQHRFVMKDKIDYYDVFIATFYIIGYIYFLGVSNLIIGLNAESTH